MATEKQEAHSLKLLRLPVVRGNSGDCRSAIYAGMAAGTFPRQVRISARAVAWPSDEVDAVIKARIAGATPAQLRTLVADLAAKRKAKC